ncbi:MAG: hypothetical protein HY519_04430 [Candidatus Aenigmarchaeota archaeon]|nr:hypothetical protein [Candidatus Aenigmarchaeota archaeon]
MKWLVLFLSIVFGIVAIPTSTALQLDNLYISLQPDTKKCFDIVLPDDLRAQLDGRIKYTVSMRPDPDESWSDISERLFQADASDAIVNPVCFATFDRKTGQCGKDFTLTLSATSAAGSRQREIAGRACASAVEDIDSAPAALDVFDLSIDRQLKTGKANEKVPFFLALYSQAEVTVDVAIDGQLEISQKSHTASLGKGKNRVQLNFTAAAVQEGEHKFMVKATARNCRQTCAKNVSASLVVAKEVADSGFSVVISPENVNVEALAQVDYAIYVRNGGQKRDLAVSLAADVQNSFYAQSFTLGPLQEQAIKFIAIPGNVSKLYELKASATSMGSTKTATAYLSTGELVTDALRQAEMARPELKDSAGGKIQSWLQAYQDAEYGSGLEERERLAQELSSMQAEEPVAGQPEAEPESNDTAEPPGLEGLALPLGALLVIIAGAAAFYLYQSRKKDSLLFESG